MSVVRHWLPPQEAEAAFSEDPERFRLIFAGLKRSWEDNKHLDQSQRSLKSCEWLSLVRSLEIERNKAVLKSSDINSAVELMLEIVLASSDCLAARTRWADQLITFLHDFRWKVTITIAWKPLYEILDAYMQFYNGRGYVGPLVKAQEVEQMVTLARRARRFFPPGAAAEIWAEIRPKIAQTHQPDAYAALSLFVLLMPTRQIRRLDADWNGWMREWMGIWESTVHSNFWDSLWLTFMSRLAKHDTAGAIDWQQYLGRIFTKALWAFQVPVGNAGATPPFGEITIDDPDAAESNPATPPHLGSSPTAAPNSTTSAVPKKVSLRTPRPPATSIPMA